MHMKSLYGTSLTELKEFWTHIVDLTLQCPNSFCKISILLITFSESDHIQSTVLAFGLYLHLFYFYSYGCVPPERNLSINNLKT
jgi:hypothetical protein